MKTLPLAVISATIIAAATTASAQQQPEFKWGGDFRFRIVHFDNIPYSNSAAESRGGVNAFQRYRTRLFGEYHPTENLYIRGRLVNEFRTVNHPRTRNGWAAFDETVFDNLFIDYQNELFGVRLGRQDLMYGNGKIIFEGTSKDGSRTTYFDAAKLTYKGIADTTVDFLAMYTHADDPLAIHSQDRDIVGYGANYDGVEAGGGIYVKNNSFEDLPWEAYFITKTQQDGLPSHDTINTVGARFMPKCTGGNLDGNIELAYQSNPDSSEFMIDALGKWHIDALAEQNGTLGLGWYYLSEDWNPVFARWPQYSELYVYSFDTTGGAAWKNVSMPHIDFSIAPIKGLKTDLLLGYMMAPENDGSGSGRNRGWLFTCKNSFTLKEGLFSESDSLGGHLLLEVFEPENYYNGSQQDKTASFARAELSYSF
ncbi:MAG: hypothetical protein JXR23_01840 [Pontiellaceae bacterium]|nr:hypothetical protein [Pontiellaceae bacterium]